MNKVIKKTFKLFLEEQRYDNDTFIISTSSYKFLQDYFGTKFIDIIIKLSIAIRIKKNEGLTTANQNEIKVELEDLLATLPFLFPAGQFLNQLACSVSNEGEEENNATNYPKHYIKSKITELSYIILKTQQRIQFKKKFINALATLLTLIIYQIIFDSFNSQFIYLQKREILKGIVIGELGDLYYILDERFNKVSEGNRKKEVLVDYNKNICQLFGFSNFKSNRVFILNHMLDGFKYYCVSNNNDSSNEKSNNKNNSSNNGRGEKENIDKVEKDEENDEYSEEELLEKSYKEIQSLAKEFGIRANLKKSEIINGILEIQSKSQKDNSNNKSKSSSNKSKLSSNKSMIKIIKQGSTFISKSFSIESDETDNSEYSDISSDGSFIHGDFDNIEDSEDYNSDTLDDYDIKKFKKELMDTVSDESEKKKIFNQSSRLLWKYRDKSKDYKHLKTTKPELPSKVLEEEEEEEDYFSSSSSEDISNLTYEERLKKYGSDYEEWADVADEFYEGLMGTDSAHEIFGGPRWLWKRREEFGWDSSEYENYR